MVDHNFQTVRLQAGRHQDPTGGVCVMELASMLAGEPFTDHPTSVCPVIALVLRAYNDGLGEERRQDLYKYASAAVGTRGSRALARRRMRICVKHFGDRVPPPAARLGRTRRLVAQAALDAGRSATDESHTRMLEFIDGLVALEGAGASDFGAPATSGGRRAHAAA